MPFPTGPAGLTRPSEDESTPHTGKSIDLPKCLPISPPSGSTVEGFGLVLAIKSQEKIVTKQKCSDIIL